MNIKCSVAIALFTIWARIAIAQEATNQKFTVNYEQMSLAEVLDDLEQKSGVNFSYSSSTIPVSDNLDLKMDNATLREILDKLFDNFPISYKMMDARVVLKYNDLRQTIRGKVMDQDSQMPIFGATVMVLGTFPILGATTNEDGEFRIENVPVGRQSLQVNYLGYETRRVPNLLVGTGKELVMDLEIVESVIHMQEVVVNATGIMSLPINEMAQVSGRSFTVEETKRFPISIGDPMRLASSYAGVVATDDGDNEIVIRGNTPRGILWRLEGVEIPSPNHFSEEGASSGGISMFSTQVISRSDFFTGAFAPEYGNATSGVFDIHLRNGNDEKRENTVQLGFIGLDVSTEGPFAQGKKSSYLFNYRYSTLTVLDVLGFNVQAENESNIFQDLSFKLNFPTNVGTFSIFGLGGLSSFEESGGSLIKDEETYNMGVLGLSHKLILNKNTFLKTTISTSGTELIDDFSRDSISAERRAFVNVTDFTKSYQRAQFNLNKKFNARHLVEVGAIFSRLTYSFNETLNNDGNTPPYNRLTLFDDEGVSGSQQAFLSWKFRLTDDLSLVNGAHWLRFDLNKESIIEPRSSIRWQVDNSRSLAFGFGLHSKIESLEYYFSNFPNADGTFSDKNTDLGLTRASHFVLSYDKQFNDKTYFKTELYYQHLFNVPILEEDQFQLLNDTLPSSDNIIFDHFSSINFSNGYIFEPMVNEGTGDNFGIEMTLERKFSDNFYYMMNGTLYSSKYKAQDGVKRNTRFDGTYAFNLLMGKEYKVGKNGKNNIFGISGKMAFAGNKRQTPINVNLSRRFNREIRLIRDTFNERLPGYFRIDLQLSFRKNKPKTTSEWRLDIQNLTNNANVVGEFYSNGRVQQNTQLGFIPILSYRLEF